MTVLLPAKTRIQKNLTPDGIEFVRPGARAADSILQASILLIFYAVFVFVPIINNYHLKLTGSGAVTTIIIAVLFCPLFVVAVKLLVWAFSGIETLFVTDTVFHHRREDALSIETHVYGMDGISRIRFSPELTDGDVSTPSCIKFACEMKTISIMAGIDEEEARMIFSDSAQKFPALSSRFEQSSGV